MFSEHLGGVNGEWRIKEDRCRGYFIMLHQIHEIDD